MPYRIQTKKEIGKLIGDEINKKIYYVLDELDKVRRKIVKIEERIKILEK